MPTRVFRDGLLTSQRVDALSSGAFEFYVRFLLVVDDYGRHEFNPNVILSEVFPTRPGRYSTVQLHGWIDECSAVSEEWDEPLLFTYKVGRKTYIQCNDTRQRTRAASKCPPPPGIVDPVYSDGKLVREGFAGEPPVPPLFAAMAPPVAISPAAPAVEFVPAADSPSQPCDELTTAAAADWAAAIYNSHPKQTGRRESIEALVRRFARDGSSRKTFEQNHALWLMTEEWRKKNGVFCPPLARRDGSGWIADEGWRSPPGNMRVKAPDPERFSEEQRRPPSIEEINNYIEMANEMRASCLSKADQQGAENWERTIEMWSKQLAETEERRQCA